jgi:hypothetical protein
MWTILEEEGDQQKGKGKISEGNWRVNVIKVHYMHVWKCHNETHYFV